MAELPSGTVTFLFTDIEGSTRLLARLRGRYAGLLAEHQKVLRAAFDEHDGHEVHTEGDAFFVAFARASDAVAAAVAGQRRLASRRWREGLDVRVRMGIHTGEAAIRQNDYVGLDVHRAARICSAGHGGQVLISRSTYALVADELPSDVALRDLGEHRLKDLDRPEHLFQVIAGDLRADFPPLGSVSPGSPGANVLPPAPNRTIGREDDVRAVADRLRVGGVRLLTLTGPGGVGKTRLALEAARDVQPEFAAGARFVSLAALRRPEDVPAAIMQSLGLLALSGESPEQAVSRYLSTKRLLFVLDNFEHLLPASRFVSELLSACPALTVLATSREPLALASEQRYPVAPLALPADEDDAEALARAPAVALFAERARAHDPGFVVSPSNARALIEVCRRVDGLPLAIELAAARCGLLSPAEIAERLEAALAILTGGPRDVPARQRTLRATVDWSYELLADEEKTCFARFAVIVGGATVEAAEAICAAGLDTLDQLVAKSLIVRVPRPYATTRLAMLETIRACAAEHFTVASDVEAVRERHYRFYVALAQRHGTERALWGANARQHFAELDADLDNMHAALAWAIALGSARHALVMATALGRYWLMRARYADAVHWIDRALSLPNAVDFPALRVGALCFKGTALWPLGRRAEQDAVLAEAEAVARQLDDPLSVAHALSTRVYHEVPARRLDVADALADEALHWATVAGDKWEVAAVWRTKAMVVSTIAELRERVERAASLLDEVGNVYLLADLLASAAYGALCLGSDSDAKEFVERATRLTRGLDNPYQSMFLRGTAGLAALLTGDTDSARRAFREELASCRELVVLPIAYDGLAGLAAVAAAHGDDHRAASLFGAAAAHRYGQPTDPVDVRLSDAFFNVARARHGADAWDTAARDGEALAFEDAITYALDGPGA
jgi:predicted ATPase/class 3 adenylate cyclase